MSKAKTSNISRSDPVHSRACVQDYPQSALIRRTERFSGMRRPGGGPNGAKSNYYRCCPEGHKMLWLGFKVNFVVLRQKWSFPCSLVRFATKLGHRFPPG